jgi:outer membrane protein insertion porin family
MIALFIEIAHKTRRKIQQEELVRTIRICQLGFFDPEYINPAFKNVDAGAGTVDVSTNWSKKGSVK